MYVHATNDFPVTEFYTADCKHALACHVNVWVCIIDTLETRNGLLGLVVKVKIIDTIVSDIDLCL
jgi:hypothetical protein